MAPQLVARSESHAYGGSTFFDTDTGTELGDVQIVATADWQGISGQVVGPPTWGATPFASLGFYTTAHSRVWLWWRRVTVAADLPPANGFTITNNAIASAELRAYRDVLEDPVLVAHGGGLTSAAYDVPAGGLLVRYTATAHSNSGSFPPLDTLTADPALVDPSPPNVYNWYSGLVAGDDPAPGGTTAPPRTATCTMINGDWPSYPQWVDLLLVGTPEDPPDPPEPVDTYRAVVRIGSHVWDVNAGDAPALGPILPLSFGWLVPEDSLGFPAQPDPDTCPLELVTATAADMAGVDIGTTMKVSIYRTTDPEARPFATFVGRVADLESSPHSRGLSWRLLGVGYTADPGGRRQVGTTAWPQESGDDRVARIMAEAGFPGWSSDPIGCTFEARGAAAADARAVLSESLAVAVTAEGNQYGPSRRVLLHPNVDADGELIPGAPFGGASVLRRVDYLDTVTAGLVNRNATWRRTKLLDAAWVQIDHPGGPSVYGDTRGPAYPPFSVPITDPEELADLVLDTTPGYRWLTEAFRLELWATLEPLALDWFWRDADSPAFPWAGRAVIVDSIAMTPDGSTRYAGMLAGARLVLEPGGRLIVEFRLRPEIPAHSTVTMRWMDEPAGATWAEELAESPAGTWYDYRTTPRP